MSDMRIQCNEEMVGAGHPTKADTLNRLVLVEHNEDGTHNISTPGLIMGLTPAYKDADEITFVGGAIDINGVVYTLDASTDVQFTGLSNDTWYFIYVGTPGSGTELSSSEFTALITVPSWDSARKCWTHTAWTSYRTIGCFKTDGSGNILPFYVSGGRFHMPTWLTALDTSSPAATATVLSLGLPSLGRLSVNIWAYAHNAGSSATLYIQDGDATEAILQGANHFLRSETGEYETGRGQFMTNASGRIFYACPAGSTTVKIRLMSFALPAGLTR